MQLARASIGLVFALGAALTGCELDLPSGDGGDDTDRADAGAVVGPACTPAECGPAPGAPNRRCDDGSWSGPGDCERHPATGKCGYVWRECPAPGASDAGGAVDAGTRPPRDAGVPDAGGPARDGSTPDGSSMLRCGTRGGLACSAEEFCNVEPDPLCGAADRGGVCEARPQVCTAIYAPVCGCDNRTHGSECAAHGAGVSVKREGPCTPQECELAGGVPKFSTGADIPRCAAGEAQWDLSGGIEPVVCCLPQAKPQPGAGKMCGGFAGLPCDDGQFCNYEPEVGGQGCEGIADAAGVCQPTPQACTREFAPVCGCDRVTYSTRCTAHAAGMSVLHDGVCTEVDCAAVGGKPVDGLGPAAVCPRGQREHTWIQYSNGMIAIEGTVCCIPQ